MTPVTRYVTDLQTRALLGKPRKLTEYEAERLADARRWNETVARGNEIARKQREEAAAEGDLFEAEISRLCERNPMM